MSQPSVYEPRTADKSFGWWRRLRAVCVINYFYRSGEVGQLFSDVSFGDAAREDVRLIAFEDPAEAHIFCQLAARWYRDEVARVEFSPISPREAEAMAGSAGLGVFVLRRGELEITPRERPRVLPLSSASLTRAGLLQAGQWRTLPTASPRWPRSGPGERSSGKPWGRATDDGHAEGIRRGARCNVKQRNDLLCLTSANKCTF